MAPPPPPPPRPVQIPGPGDLEPGRVPPALRSLRRKGRYESELEFLSIHCELLQEDLTRTLHEQVNRFRKKRRETARMFWVRFERPDPREEDHDHGLRVIFENKDLSERDEKYWEERKILLFSSIVLFSPDNFDTYFVGTVKSSPPRLNVSLREDLGTRDVWQLLRSIRTGPSAGRFLMLECDCYFFPYILASTRLANIHVKTPFLDEIVFVKKPKRATPKYILFRERKTASDLMSDIRSLEEGGVLTPSQEQAMKKVFQSRLALVQGPPGTGKTYLACQIVKFINRHGVSPVLVASETNHAVEEFLDRCMGFTDKIIYACSRWNMEGKAKYGELQTKYHDMLLERMDKEERKQEQIDLFAQADVIGMTTTKACLLSSQLTLVGVEAMIVEEAAESLVALVVAAIPHSVKHLILMGDHFQLQPSTSHSDMVRYGMDVSLLEWLVRNGFDCPMLLEQRRMRPDISKLIAHIYDYELVDHPCTEGRPDVQGVQKNLFFLDHREPESQEAGNPSICNEHEVRMAVFLAEYLVDRGAKAEDVTILTTYKLQEGRIKKFQFSRGSAASKCTTVDNFQGEESRIIILILVRSNLKGCVGFMAKENRVCVALSRARDGLYILGDYQTYSARGNPTWEQVFKVLRSQGSLGSALPLVCPHGRKFEAASEAQMKTATDGCEICQVKRNLVLARASSADARRELKIAQALHAVALQAVQSAAAAEYASAAKAAKAAKVAKANVERATLNLCSQQSELREALQRKSVARQRFELFQDCFEEQEVEELLIENDEET